MQKQAEKRCSQRWMPAVAALALAGLACTCSALTGLPSPTATTAPPALPATAEPPATITPPTTEPAELPTPDEGAGGDIAAPTVPAPQPRDAGAGALAVFIEPAQAGFLFLDLTTGEFLPGAVTDEAAGPYQRYHPAGAGVAFWTEGQLHHILPGATDPELITPPAPNPPAWDGKVEDAMMSPDGARIAWLARRDDPACTERPCPRDYWLVLSDASGQQATAIWTIHSSLDNLHNLRLLSWRDDGGMVYLARPPEMLGAAFFDISPGVLGVETPSGAEHVLGQDDLFHVGESAVSRDGRWLAEAFSHFGVSPPQVGLMLTDLSTGESELLIALPDVALLGDFQFSPDVRAVAWTEASSSQGAWTFTTRLVSLGGRGDVQIVQPWEGLDSTESYPHAVGWLDANTLLLQLAGPVGGVHAYDPSTGSVEFFETFAFVGLTGG